MEVTLSKVAVFCLINLVVLAVAGTTLSFVVWDQFWNHPVIFSAEVLFLCLLLPLLEVSYFKSVFGDPGRLTKEHSEHLKTEEEVAAIRADTAAFRRKLNSARRFVSLGGESILPEQADPELLEKFGKMSVRKINQEMEKIYLDYLDRRLECKRCGLVKPPRAHHCQTCGGCVRRMDHHCPWIANCVGEDNTRSFIQFTFYASLGLANCGLTILLFYVLNPYQVRL